jgi:hypothetical protein
MDLATTLFADIPAPRAPARTGRIAPDPEFAWRVLEEIDYGLILVDPEGRFQHANQSVR